MHSSIKYCVTGYTSTQWVKKNKMENLIKLFSCGREEQLKVTGNV